MAQITQGTSLIRIGDRMVDISNIKELNEAVAVSSNVKYAQTNFDQIQDQVSISDKKILSYSKLMFLLNELNSVSKDLAGTIDTTTGNLTTIFDKKQIIPAGELASSIANYAEIIADNNADNNNLEFSIDAIAKPMLMKSVDINLQSKQSVVGDTLPIRAGSFKVMVLNNARKLNYLTNSTQSVVLANPGTGVKAFKAGTFFLNTYPLTLTVGMKLIDVAQLISNANLGVTATINPSDQSLVLRSTKLGIENDYKIEDPSSVFTPLIQGSGPIVDSAFTALPDYTSITLQNGNTLIDVANKINATNCGIKAKAIMVTNQISKLSLEGNLTGLGNNFKIIDGIDGTGKDILLDGTKSGSVFKDIFLTQSGAYILNGSNARLTIGYDTIERQENTIKNYLDNLTIKILNPTPQGKKIQFAIAPDYNAIIDKIDTLIDYYNQIIKFVTQQKQRDLKGNPLPGSELASDSSLYNIIEPIKNYTFILLKQLIGFNAKSIEEEYQYQSKDQKDINTKRITYPNLLTMNQDTLTKKLFSNITDVKKAFSYNVSSSNSNFTLQGGYPKALLKNVEVNVDKINLTLQTGAPKEFYNQSMAFQNASTSVVNSTGTNGNFKAGKFYFNKYPVELVAGDSLSTIATKINAISANSNLTVSQIQQTYGGVNYYFLKIDNNNLKPTVSDPDNVFSTIFSTTAKIDTAPFTMAEINLVLGIIPLIGIFISKSIKINNTVISFPNPPYTIANFVAVFNSHQATTGVTARYTTIPGTIPSYIITFEPLNMGNLVIVDSSSIFGSTTFNKANFAGGAKFYDTPETIVTASVEAVGVSYTKPAKFNTSTSNINTVTLTNDDTSGLNLNTDNLKIFYTGSGNDSTVIDFTRGIAVQILLYINKLNSDKGILKYIMNNLNNKGDQLKQESNKLATKLNNEKEKTMAQFSKIYHTNLQHHQMQEALKQLISDNLR